MSKAYYNEFDPYAAQWLRNLIDAGQIAPGDVDERSITEVRAEDLAGYTQCHFFAGIGGWSLALRLAGWPDDRPVWTGSCPCQPFSNAGKRKGTDDERHLWPIWRDLIRECRPPVVFGEQVANAATLGRASGSAKRDVAGDPAWLDVVFHDLENAGYTCGAADIPSAGISAPHIRQRLWFVGVADAVRGRTDPRRLSPKAQTPPCGEGRGLSPESCDGSLNARVADPVHAGRTERRTGAGDGSTPRCSVDGRMADADNTGSQGRFGVRERPDECASRTGSVEGRMANPGCVGLRSGQPGGLAGETGAREGEGAEREWFRPDAEHDGARSGTGSADSPWRDVDWLFCRDGKWRPVESSVLGMAARLPEGMVRSGAERSAAYPLAQGVEARVQRLKGYGNAIVPQVGAEFIRTAMRVTASRVSE